MNFRSGILRLWITFSVFWVAGSGWILWDDLRGECPDVADPNGTNICELAKKFGSWPSYETVRAVQIVVGIPLLALVLVASLLWVWRGFSKVDKDGWRH